MKARIWIIVAVIVALGGGLGLGALLFGGDDGGSGDDVATDSTSGGHDDAGSDGTATTTGAGEGPTTPATATTLPPLPATTVPIEGLTGDDLELANAINRAHQLTYHILLRSTDPNKPGETEIWRRLPEARRDLRLGSGDARLETREFRSPTLGHIGCLIDTSGTEQTTCVQAPPGELDPADPTLGAVDPSAGGVTASDEQLGNLSMRCFTQTVADAQHVACFDQDGIPAVLDGGDGRYERVGEPERGVTDDTFVPPNASFIPNDPDAITSTTAGPQGDDSA